MHGEHEEHHECRDDVTDIDAVVAALELSREVGELLDTLMRGIDENLVGYGSTASATPVSFWKKCAMDQQTAVQRSRSV